jgi:tetratricopeptide (TPR) repeat protein
MNNCTMNNCTNNNIKDFHEIDQLLEDVREKLKSLPKGICVSKKQYKVPIEYCENKINNGDCKYIAILFMIYFYDVCDFTEGIIFLQHHVNPEMVKDADLLEELKNIMNKTTSDPPQQYCTYTKEEWENWDMLERFGIRYWMIDRVYNEIGEEEKILINKLQFMGKNGNIKAYLNIGEVYEYCGEWKNAYNTYNSALDKFDPVTSDDVEIRKKLVESSLRTCNLENFERPNKTINCDTSL